VEQKIEAGAQLEAGRGRPARRAYGFDEVALVPGAVTIDPEDVDISWSLGGRRFALPVLASSMDAVVDVRFAGILGALGGLAVLNLQGVATRYENPEAVIERIVTAPVEQAVPTLQQVYAEPVKDELIKRRVAELRALGVPTAVASTPAAARHVAGLIGPGGVDVFVVASTVTTARHLSSRYETPSLGEIRELVGVPLIAGNCVTYEAGLELMRAGVDGVLVGVGPGAACTTRRVLGLGVPQVTAVADVAAARDDFEAETGKRVGVIADGGMRVGGDVSKAIAAGADAVMIGSPLARAEEAPGRGFHWGMATSDRGLPRGTRIRVGTDGPLRQILLGPTSRDDGAMNLLGALRLAMGCCGAANIGEMQKVELVIAPALPSEGKVEQRAQSVGMGK